MATTQASTPTAQPAQPTTTTFGYPMPLTVDVLVFVVPLLGYLLARCR